MARRMAQNGAPTHEIERQGRWKQGGGMVGAWWGVTPAVSRLGRRCGISNRALARVDQLIQSHQPSGISCQPDPGCGQGGMTTCPRASPEYRPN